MLSGTPVFEKKYEQHVVYEYNKVSITTFMGPVSRLNEIKINMFIKEMVLVSVLIEYFDP